MFSKLKTGILVNTLVIAMGSAAFAAPIGVASVAVKAELASIENQTALEKWPNIAEDLRAAIGKEVFPATDPAGIEVNVRVISLSLDGSYQLGDDGRFNTMEGVVMVRRPNEPESAEGMPIRLTASAGTVVADAGTIVIPPTSDDFYSAMINAFATQVGEKVREFDK
jgi:hypothetical protein